MRERYKGEKERPRKRYGGKGKEKVIVVQYWCATFMDFVYEEDRIDVANDDGKCLDMWACVDGRRGA